MLAVVAQKERLREPQSGPELAPAPVRDVVAAPPSVARSPTVSDVLRLQQSAGNVAVGRLLRQPAGATATPTPTAAPVPKTDEEQWEEDLVNPAFAGALKHFDTHDRPNKEKEERYRILCPLYKAHGILRPLKYVDDNIHDRRFFGHGSPMHDDLWAKLSAAQTALKTAGVTTAPFGKMFAFVPRTQSGGQWSNHADGKAIDFDEVTNPRLLDPGRRKVITALTGVDVSLANPGTGAGPAAGMDSYDSSKLASDTFMGAYSVSGMTDRIDELEGEEKELVEERDDIQAEAAGVPTGRKATRADRDKLKAITARLKAKQAEITANIAARKTLGKEIKRFEALDQAVADLNVAFWKLDGEADQLADDLKKLEAGESLEAGKAALTGKKLAAQIKAKKAAIAAKATAIKKTQKKFDAAVKAQDDDTMRGYADVGFLDLDKDLVTALKTAGLGWGGDYAGAKDYMHFEVK
jgi:hypothetical protein